jgi:hypothetical protein
MASKRFAVTFPRGICGLEIVFDSETKEFSVNQCHRDIAKKYISVIKSAKVLSVNWKSTLTLSGVEDIQEMFKKYEQIEKRVVFQATLEDEQLKDLLSFDEDAEFNVLDCDERGLKPGQYSVELQTRPLGFTIAFSPKGGVEVVQVDSVHEEELKLGSRLLAVNEKLVKSKDVMATLLTCFMPVRLVLERADEANIFSPEEKDDGEAPTWLALSRNTGDMVELSIHWFDEKLGKTDFILLIKPDATVAEIRAKIAVTSQLKFNAVKLVSKQMELKDDGQKLCDLNFKESEKVTVIVSQTTQDKTEEKVSVDYLVEMKIMGAFLKSCDPELLQYLWNDIDHDEKGVLHITELDRLLTRFMGLYERANCVYRPMEYKHGSVQFNTTEKLGLVIEGNEVIMSHPGSQAERAGFLPGWKVVGAEYEDKVGRMVKFPVDHRSCLHSLKRAKNECASGGFFVLCLIPVGQKYETIIIMKKQAISDLKLDGHNNVLMKKHYDQLPDVFAGKAVRITFKEPLEASEFCAGTDKGAIISKETTNEQLKSFTDAHVLSINATTVVHMPFGDVMKVLLANKPPHVLTLEDISS